jgi:nitrite reductase/ring-hydroxylating ferredoxin subunit
VVPPRVNEIIMREVKLGSVSAFSDPGRKVIEIDGVEIGVFHIKGQFTAYGNICPHMGGPVCQGKILPRVEEDIAADRKSRGFVFSKTETNIVCPWHGYEFDIRTGRHQGNQKLRLRPLDVLVVEGEVFVLLPDRTLRPQTT